MQSTHVHWLCYQLLFPMNLTGETRHVNRVCRCQTISYQYPCGIKSKCRKPIPCHSKWVRIFFLPLNHFIRCLPSLPAANCNAQMKLYFPKKGNCPSSRLSCHLKWLYPVTTQAWVSEQCNPIQATETLLSPVIQFNSLSHLLATGFHWRPRLLSVKRYVLLLYLLS